MEKNEYTPPTSIWDINAVLDFEEPLDDDDPRYVPTEKGRGVFSFQGLLRTLGVDSNTFELRSPRDKSYNLFCGHMGCGKSTELRRLKKKLDRGTLFFVVFLDALEDLDPHNLQYSDVLLALAEKLLIKMEESEIKIDDIFLKNLTQWFSEKILKNEKLKDFSVEAKADIEMSSGIPFLAKLTAKLTSKIKSGATYKEEIRLVVKNTFSEFAFAFNQLIAAADEALKKAAKGKKLLFIVDGTDRLKGEDSRRFFIEDVYQLQQIDANFIYCAPIHLLYENKQVQRSFSTFILPMIKISPGKNSTDKYMEGYEVLRKILYKRADKQLFESEQMVDLLIENSGGNPRDLLRLVHYAIQVCDMERFKKTDAEGAIKSLAAEYRRFLNVEDYEILYKIDGGEIEEGNSEQIRRLLYNLAILEYNSGWWRAHPVIRRLDGYKKIESKANE